MSITFDRCDYLEGCRKSTNGFLDMLTLLGLKCKWSNYDSCLNWQKKLIEMSNDIYLERDLFSDD